MSNPTVGMIALDKPLFTRLREIRRRAIRVLARLAGMLILFFLVVLVWVWLWRTTGVPPAFLLAATFALVGLILVAWSYAPVYRG